MELDLWGSFALDPRDPVNASLRASDSDRDVVRGLLAAAYADGRLDREEFDERSDTVTSARLLGELPPIVDDLVPAAPAPSIALVKATALYGEFFWPGFVIAGTGINLVQTLVRRQDIIDGHVQRLKKKRAKELGREQRRELEGPADGNDDQ